MKSRRFKKAAPHVYEEFSLTKPEDEKKMDDDNRETRFSSPWHQIVY